MRQKIPFSCYRRSGKRVILAADFELVEALNAAATQETDDDSGINYE